METLVMVVFTAVALANTWLKVTSVRSVRKCGKVLYDKKIQSKSFDTFLVNTLLQYKDTNRLISMNS